MSLLEGISGRFTAIEHKLQCLDESKRLQKENFKLEHINDGGISAAQVTRILDDIEREHYIAFVTIRRL